MTVDSYAFLPRSFRPMYESAPWWDHEPAWAELAQPVSASRVGLLSSAGMFLRGEQEPFDVEREKREPTWGDPTMRILPDDVTQDRIDARHLHINTADLLVDMNVALPIARLHELADAGVVGSSAPIHFSLMGFQEEGAHVWRDEVAPEIVTACARTEIDALVLAPA